LNFKNFGTFTPEFARSQGEPTLFLGVFQVRLNKFAPELIFTLEMNNSDNHFITNIAYRMSDE
jgi:hypothetical protein